MRHIQSTGAVFLALAPFVAILAGCAGKRAAIDTFAEHQKTYIQQKAIYDQAEFNFSVAVYEPTLEDVQGLRNAWIDYGSAFPESKGFGDIENAVRKSAQKTVLVALFMTQYENADLKNKALGWTVAPTPFAIEELPNDDEILRKFMPIQNAWTRYYLLSYAQEMWGQSSDFTVANPQGKIVLKLNRQ